MKNATIFKKGYIFFIFLLVVAAVCKSLQAPLSSIMLEDTGPMTTLALLCIGALIFGLFWTFIKRKELKTNPVRRLQKKDTLPILLITLSDLAGNILFLIGLSMCLASTAALLKCFGLVATTVIAFIFLRERISRRLFVAILLITLGCITISVGDIGSIAASPGVLLVLASCITSGISYTLKKKVADRDPGLVVIISDGIMVVVGLILAGILGEGIPDLSIIVGGILLGLVIFGVPTIIYLITARKLGAAKCTSVLNFSPFIGAGISFVLFQQAPTLSFFISFLLLIPGFYLVIVDKDEKQIIDGTAASPPPVEIYHDHRNYLTAFGLLTAMAIEVIYAMINLIYILNGEITQPTFIAGLSVAVAQITVGCILIILHRRDFTGMTMLVFGFTTIVILNIGSLDYFLFGVLGIHEIILACIVLFLKERKKYCYSLLFLLVGLSSLFYAFLNDPTISMILNAISSIWLLIMVIGSSGVLPRFRLTKLLAEDESLEFEKVGSAICYVILAISILPWMGTYIFGTEIVSLETVGNFSLGCGIMIGILAVLMMFVAKNNFLSVVFLGIMLSLLLAGSTTDLTNYIAGIVMFLTGMFCLFRKRSYLLPGLLCILYGIASFTSIVIHGETVLVVSQFTMHSLVFCLAIYLAIAVFSQNKKLPLF